MGWVRVEPEPQTGIPGHAHGYLHRRRIARVPLVQISVVEGALTDSQKSQLISKVSEAVLSVYGEGLRPHTWVIVQDVRSGQWGLGGRGLTTEDVKGLMATPATG